MRLECKIVYETYSAASNLWKNGQKVFATFLAKMFQARPPEKPISRKERLREGMTLYSWRGRKYLNTAERRRFVSALKERAPAIRLFCLTLMWTGCRLSEARALAPRCFDVEGGTVAIETLKRRKAGIVGQGPIAPRV